MATYAFKIKSFTFEHTPSDVNFTVNAYLADMAGVPFIVNGAIDLFAVSSAKSSLQTSYADYWTLLAQNAINSKYTTTITGIATAGSAIIEDMESTSALVVGMSVYGTPAPTDTSIQTVRDATSIIMSQNATVAGSYDLTFTANSWFIDFSSINLLVSQVNFGNF